MCGQGKRLFGTGKLLEIEGQIYFRSMSLAGRVGSDWLEDSGFSAVIADQEDERDGRYERKLHYPIVRV